MISDVARTSRVLVIDDDPQSVELVKRVLTRAGFNTVESTSEPSIALSLLREIEPHVVLLDINMPKIDGFAVLETLRDEADRVGSSIIMLTGAADHAVQVTALQRGASDFVTKPFEHPVLVARPERPAARSGRRPHRPPPRDARYTDPRRSRAEALA